MTDETVNVYIGDETIGEAPAPKGQYYATVKERRILVKNINSAQSMILGRLFRQSNSLTEYGDALDILGKIGALFDALVVNEADRRWLEDGILAGLLDIEDFGALFTAVEAPAEKKKRVPRRGK